jgi:phycocyanobilin:ferredoxin oxidoreductase
VRPNSSEEDSLFLSRVESYLEIHVKLALKSQPVSGEEATQVIAGQRYYCTKQQKNDKTRRVLEKAFGQEWAEHYMTTVLFDCAD